MLENCNIFTHHAGIKAILHHNILNLSKLKIQHLYGQSDSKILFHPMFSKTTVFGKIHSSIMAHICGPYLPNDGTNSQ